jgi:hypothetical protein
MKNKIITLTICILALGTFLILYDGTPKNNHKEQPKTYTTYTAIKYNKKNKKKKTTKKNTTKKKSTKKKTTKQKHSKSECMNFAHNEVINRYHWNENDWNALVKLWNRESGWNASTVNKRSGACGIPQALPCSKMKSRGSDYKTNCYTQINWGLGYIASRYGNPSKAWQHSQKKGWY